MQRKVYWWPVKTNGFAARFTKNRANTEQLLPFASGESRSYIVISKSSIKLLPLSQQELLHGRKMLLGGRFNFAGIFIQRGRSNEL